jgi:hypothetical protein
MGHILIEVHKQESAYYQTRAPMASSGPQAYSKNGAGNEWRIWRAKKRKIFEDFWEKCL